MKKACFFKKILNMTKYKNYLMKLKNLKIKYDVGKIISKIQLLIENILDSFMDEEDLLELFMTNVDIPEI